MSSRKIVDLRGRRAEPKHAPQGRRSDTYERPHSALRTKRRHRRILFSLFGIAVLIGCVFGLGWVSYLPQFAIQEVRVSGAREMPPAIIRTFAESFLSDSHHPLFAKNTVFLYPRRALEQAIQTSFPRVVSVHISKESILAQTIDITIQEREPYARWCDSGSCYVLDDTGFIFAEAASSTTQRTFSFSGSIASSTMPVGQSYLPGHFADIRTFLERLLRSGFTPVAINEDVNQDVSVTFDDGMVIQSSFGQDPYALVNNLELILSSKPLQGHEKEVEYIDLRFGDRVFYKMKNGERMGS